MDKTRVRPEGFFEWIGFRKEGLLWPLFFCLINSRPGLLRVTSFTITLLYYNNQYYSSLFIHKMKKYFVDKIIHFVDKYAMKMKDIML